LRRDFTGRRIGGFGVRGHTYESAGVHRALGGIGGGVMMKLAQGCAEL